MSIYTQIKLVAKLLITVLISGGVFSIGYSLLSQSWQERQLNLRYQTEGVRTQAKLIGYRYGPANGKMNPAGDRPLLMYTDANGVTHTHLAQEYGLVGEYGRRTLPSRQIEVTYLKSEPEQARVEAWCYSNPFFGAMLGIFASLPGLIVAIFILRSCSLFLWRRWRNLMRKVPSES